MPPKADNFVVVVVVVVVVALLLDNLRLTYITIQGYLRQLF